MLYYATGCMLGISALYYIVKNIRYNLRYFTLLLITKKKKGELIWVSNVEDAKRYLQMNNTKGIVEETFSKNAWKPLLSLETENGAEWMKLKERFIQLQKQLPSPDLLKTILYDNIHELTGEITSNEIAMLTIKCFIEFIFGVNCCIPEISLLYAASTEFKKELAMKGYGNNEKKMLAVELISKLLKNSKYNLTNDIYSISVILQAFIISPSINISDIAVHYDRNKTIDENICFAHPFPILERSFIKNNITHYVIIPSDELKILPFGYGERKCLGVNYAKIFIEHLFSNLMTNSNIQYLPKQNHKYSGRDNDDTMDIEAIHFQITRLAAVFFGDLFSQTSAYFNNDRLVKYGFGVVRLGTILYFMNIQLSLRLLIYTYLGSIGAVVNVEILNFTQNMVLLGIGGISCLLHSYYFDYYIFFCLAKTFVGDFIAGKLDTTEWLSVLGFIISTISAFAVLQSEMFFEYIISEYLSVIVIFFIHLITELGDNYLEHFIFFRHRYSFEIMNILAYLYFYDNLPAQMIIKYDLYMCFYYRLSNLGIIIYKLYHPK